MYWNKAEVMGNLTRKPELRALQNGTKVASFSIAVNDSYKNKEGVKVESVEYVNCVAWGKAGELIAQYMDKGSHIFVSGKLRTSSWETDGVKKYKTEIVVRDFQFGRKSTGATATTEGAQHSPAETTQDTTPKEDTIEYPDEDINPDDIPF
ncbi:MAG TPA: single-stranded DNA-binding protein [Candidatus Kaiserbacteria bacterium]|nr:single-stranded DNA-binding protein [Candidatus Kaiserbacteria bacterium]